MDVVDKNTSKQATEWLIQELEQSNLAWPVEAVNFTAGDWALAIEMLSANKRLMLWETLPESLSVDILSQLNEDVRGQLLKKMNTEDVVNTVVAASSEDMIDIIDAMPSRLVRKIRKHLQGQDKDKVDVVLQYGTDQIGRYISRDLFIFDMDATVGELKIALDQMDATTSIPKHIFLEDGNHKFYAMLGLHQLLNQPSELLLKDIDELRKDIILDTDELLPSANQLRRMDENYVAVVNAEGVLQGKLTAMTAMEILEEEYRNQVMHLAKMDDEDLFAPIGRSAAQRAVWLGINLVTAFLAAWVIGLFENALAQLVALAVLMPIVASMGGIAGSQTLTLTIRGLATDQLGAANIKVLFKKETWVVAINGLLWAIVVGISTFFWFEDTKLSLVISMAIIINMVVAALSGIFIPYFMKKVHIDPALAGSVVLTTVSDVVGFFVFLGAATVFLL